MPRVASLQPLLRNTLADSDLFIVFDKSEQQDEPLKKISRMELGAAILSAFNESDTLHSVTSRGSTTTNNITVNDALINGDLTVQGTTTTVNSTELTVTDKNITLGNGLTSSTLADGGGITLDGANASIQWSHSSQCWEFSHTLCYPGELETTDSLPEGSLNLYYTNDRVDARIPTNVSSFTNDANYATTSQLFSGSYNDLTDKPTIPTNNNQLTNGAGYITDYTVTEGDITGIVDSAYVQARAGSGSGGGGFELQYGQYGASNATLNPGDTAVIKLLGDLSGNSVGVVLSRNNNNNDRLINSNFNPSSIATYTNSTGSAITGVNAFLLSNPVNFFWGIDRA